MELRGNAAYKDCCDCHVFNSGKHLKSVRVLHDAPNAYKYHRCVIGDEWPETVLDGEHIEVVRDDERNARKHGCYVV